jgi:hypothetical protein
MASRSIDKTIERNSKANYSYRLKIYISELFSEWCRENGLSNSEVLEDFMAEKIKGNEDALYSKAKDKIRKKIKK